MKPSFFLCRNSTAYAVLIVFLRQFRIIKLKKQKEETADGSAAGLVWSINRTLEIFRDKEENMLGIGMGISVFFLLLVLVFGFAIVPCVLKLDRLTEACMKDNTYSVKVGNTRKQAHYLTINLKTKDKKTAWAETSRKSAMALQEELESRCPGIDTAGGAVLPE